MDSKSAKYRSLRRNDSHGRLIGLLGAAAAVLLLSSACESQPAAATAPATATTGARAISTTAPTAAATTAPAATNSPAATAVAAPRAEATAESVAPASIAADCPNGGTVRFGVEPFDENATMLPAYKPMVDALAKTLNCKVQLFIPTNYNAEIEAMRAGKLEVGEFGPLGYVLAHQVAKADAIATFADKDGKIATYFASIVTWPGSGITDLKGVTGRSFAYSDPASTSGHLFPAYGLKKNGIDPDKGVKAVYAGSHTSSFEAIRNHKVEAGELNSDKIASATKQGIYSEADFPTLWKSDPIPQDPIAVRSDLPAAFKDRLAKALLALDLSTLPTESQSVFASMGGSGSHLIATTDATYNGIRDLVSVLNVDLSKL